MQKFYRCDKCNNIVGVINEGAGQLTCCGEPMTLLKPNTVEASGEKHIPVFEINGHSLTVKVGSIDHPMTDEHYIQWVYICTETGGQRFKLLPGEEPKAMFCVKHGKPVAIYAYCNLHGLWAVDVTE